MSTDRIEPWREGAEDDEALALAVKTAGETVADQMGWHVTQADYGMARRFLVAGREALEAPLRAELRRQTVHREDVGKMLRMACEEFGDNDWPDNLHLADVLEKHLLRPIRQDLEAQEAEISALGEQVATLKAESEALSASLRVANNVTRVAQSRAERAETLFRERQKGEAE
jgi:hypothetical protein